MLKNKLDNLLLKDVNVYPVLNTQENWVKPFFLKSYFWQLLGKIC